MKVDFLGLEAFIGIADLGSFRRAAAHLNLSQTAVSHRVRKLEESIGAPLFNRATRQVTLTEAGADLLPRARDLLREVEAHVARVRDRNRAQQDSLAIACLPTIAFEILPAALARFRRVYPQAAVRIYDKSAAEIGELVVTGEADFGITILAANRWDLQSEPLLTEDYLLVCKKDHPLAGRAAVAWADLAREPLIRVSQQTGNRIIVDEALGARSERLSWTYEVHHTLTAFMLVRHGVGLAITPRIAIGASRDGDLAAIPLVKPKVARTIGIVSRRDKPASPLARAMQRALHEEFEALPGNQPRAASAMSS